MGQDEMSYHVAFGSQIGRRIEWLRERDQPERGGLIRLARRPLVLDDGIPHRGFTVYFSRHIPSAPALAERAVLVGDERLAVRGLCSRSCRIDGAQQNAGNSACTCGDV